MYITIVQRERERNVIRGTMMKWCGYVEKKAYFQKLRGRVKTITHYTKRKKRNVAKVRMLKQTKILQGKKTRNGSKKTGSV